MNALNGDAVMTPATVLHHDGEVVPSTPRARCA
jgi:hypothetical protein